jgi:signal peptide peptidase SppA
MSHNPECFTSHMGLWLIKGDIFKSACAMISRGHDLRVNGHKFELMRGDDQDERKREPYQIADGIAIINLQGAMSKGSSKYGASTTQARRDIRLAANDQRVEGIMIRIDSPGGTAAGTGDLGDEIRMADRIKPTYAHADDMIASAAYWTGSQARRLTMNKYGEAGSIGVVAIAYDESEAMEREGIKVIVMSVGEHKADFAPGTPITEEMIKRHEVRMHEINDAFVQAIAKGRKVPLAKAKEWNTGETWGAATAKEMGLIDEVMSFDEAMAAARRDLSAMASAKARTRNAERSLRI